MEPVPEPARPPVEAGLCGHCRNARSVETRRGSRFILCDLSRTDARFARYPSLPVLRCDGFDPGVAPEPTADA
jgi:hypothetical protein